MRSSKLAFSMLFVLAASQVRADVIVNFSGGTNVGDLNAIGSLENTFANVSGGLVIGSVNSATDIGDADSNIFGGTINGDVNSSTAIGAARITVSGGAIGGNLNVSSNVGDASANLIRGTAGGNIVVETSIGNSVLNVYGFQNGFHFTGNLSASSDFGDAIINIYGGNLVNTGGVVTGNLQLGGTINSSVSAFSFLLPGAGQINLIPTALTPEPDSFAFLTGMGVTGIAFLRRRKQAGKTSYHSTYSVMREYL